MTDAPEKIWHTIDRRGKISGSPDAHVEPCSEVSEAYLEYTRTDISQARIAELELALDGLLEIADPAWNPIAFSNARAALKPKP
jgi:hypothetical protein